MPIRIVRPSRSTVSPEGSAPCHVGSGGREGTSSGIGDSGPAGSAGLEGLQASAVRTVSCMLGVGSPSSSIS